MEITFNYIKLENIRLNFFLFLNFSLTVKSGLFVTNKIQRMRTLIARHYRLCSWKQPHAGCMVGDYYDYVCVCLSVCMPCLSNAVVLHTYIAYRNSHLDDKPEFSSLC